jgi:hypothetical protein
MVAIEVETQAIALVGVATELFLPSETFIYLDTI